MSASITQSSQALHIARRTLGAATLECFLLAGSSAVLPAALRNQRLIAGCHRPLRAWLLVACCLGYLFAGVFMFGRHAEGGADWWFVEPKTRIGLYAFRASWAALLPAIAATLVLGAWWLSETLDQTPECFVPEGRLTPTFLIVVQMVSGFGSLVYAILVSHVWHAARCREANRAIIKSVEDGDLVERWGEMTPGASMDLLGGLCTEDIAKLPRFTVRKRGGGCVICLAPLEQGDVARKLPECGHVFHRPCIDLWLLRNPKCPLCNTSVCISPARGAPLEK